MPVHFNQLSFASRQIFYVWGVGMQYKRKDLGHTVQY